MTYTIILGFGILAMISAMAFTGFYLIERWVLKDGGRLSEAAISKYSAVTNGINCIVAILAAFPIYCGTILPVMMLFAPSNTNIKQAMYAIAPFATVLCFTLLFALIRKLTNKLLAPSPGLGWKGILGSAVITTIISFVIYFITTMVAAMIGMMYFAPGPQ